MIVKIQYILIGILAAALALFCALLPQNHGSKGGTAERSFPETDCEYSSDENALAYRPVIIPAKRMPAESGSGDQLEGKPQIPLGLESWLQGLRRQLLEKVEVQMRRNGSDNPVQMHAGKKEQHVRRSSLQGADETTQNDSDSGDVPFLLWRELQLRGDNRLVINLLLVNNRREGQSRGVIVSQTIPEGWNLSAAWPDIQASDPGRREVKWLFAEAASRGNWILQVVLTPDEQAEIPLLPEENTTVRCCLPGGSLMQYACISLP